MKRTNKKGFTLVELVIVIAIIAILAAVLIPTFSGVVDKANESSARQSGRNAYTAIMAASEANFDKWCADRDTTQPSSTNYVSVCETNEETSAKVDSYEEVTFTEYFSKITSVSIGTDTVTVKANGYTVKIGANGVTSVTKGV